MVDREQLSKLQYFAEYCADGRLVSLQLAKTRGGDTRDEEADTQQW